MVYLGKVNGPKVSDVLRRLGSKHFKVSEQALKKAIAEEEEREKKKELIPVYGSSKGAFFICWHFSSYGEDVYLTKKEIRRLKDYKFITAPSLSSQMQGYTLGNN